MYSLIYAVEREGPDEASWSFYDSFWWGLMTLTTVGYNLTPVTFTGLPMLHTLKRFSFILEKVHHTRKNNENNNKNNTP